MATKTSGKIANKLDADFKQNGAIGDGTTNDTTKVNQVLSIGDPVIDFGDFLVDDNLVNNQGTIIHNAALLKAVTGGKRQLNTYADHYQRVTGLEYLLPYQSKKLLGIATKEIWSGDSTTEGGSYLSSSNYLVNNIFASLATSNGLVVNSINRGHSGKNTQHWATSFVSSDIAESPDLYILRWGINDPFYKQSDNTEVGTDSGQEAAGRRTATDMINSLRAGLTIIRQNKQYWETSVIIMTPNSTFDIPNGRDSRYYEKLRKGIVKAGRDFQCAVIDNYAARQDSKLGVAAGIYDNPFGDGRGIHAKDVYNISMVSSLYEVVIPVYLRKSAGIVSSLPGYSSTGTYQRVIINGIEQWATVGNGTVTPNSPQPLAFTTNNTTYSNGEYSRTQPNQSGQVFPGNEVTTGKKLASATDGRIQVVYTSIDNADAIFGYNDTATAPTRYEDVKIGFYVDSSNSIIRTIVSGTPTNVPNNVTATNGLYLAIVATGRSTSPIFKLVSSATEDFANFTELATYSGYTVSGDLFPVMSINGQKKISQPKQLNLT